MKWEYLMKVQRKRDVNGNSIFRVSINTHTMKPKTYQMDTPFDAIEQFIKDRVGKMWTNHIWMVVNWWNGFKDETIYHIEGKLKGAKA